MSLVQNTEVYSPVYDNLFAGTQVQPVVADAITLAAGQGILPVGAVLGKVTATGVYKLCDSTAEDGSNEVACILAVEVDTGAGDPVAASGWFTGEYNVNALTFGGEDTAEDHANDPRVGVSIFFKENVK